ncbi:hypothetical protein M3Y94_00476600 [Aphelenchoides besseyi]|nr:hypothetical protein M3Y94_00476600 [Aphelenchoides besseyi]KAI6219920.1 Palmitoyltransferase [Aphelenchoides besseyi]
MSRVAVHERRRRNGWSLPINPLQVVSWVVIILLNLFTLIISLPLPGHPTVPLIFAIAFVWITFCILYATSTDPGTGNSVVPVAFDRSLHSHVIEKNFCNICQINVQKGTKHCRRCNKCIDGFDHHCKWLNNCVGQRNYKAFLVLVASLVVFSLCSFIFFLWSIGLFITKTSKEEPVPDSFAKDWLIFDVWNWFVLCILVVLLDSIILGSTLHLLSFHIMLWFNGQTTFSYVLKQRKRQKQSTDQSSDQTQNSTKSLPVGERRFRSNHASRSVGDSTPISSANAARPT